MNTAQTKNLFFIYGPPGSGKSSLGRKLAENLALPFIDLDEWIEAQAGQTINEIFATEGETGFRQRERAGLEEAVSRAEGVVALGGGALLDVACRALAENAGDVVCLSATPAVLRLRLEQEAITRPLLKGDAGWEDRLDGLLERRAAHYASFKLQIDTTDLSVEAVAQRASVCLGAFHINGMGAGYDVRVAPGGLDALGEMLRQRKISGAVALVSDSHTGPLYAARVQASLERCGYSVRSITIPAGEEHKTIATVASLWEEFIAGGLDRGSTVVALGGGVTSDLTGFAAATYLRGVRWVTLPTTLLCMADASLGGKTGADLANGKNLIGAFHPPVLVLADPQVLATLPEPELRSGLGEVVKHGILADTELFERCMQGWDAVNGDWDDIVRRAVAVKIGFIQADPYEKGMRAALNLGHTIGHAVELASGFQLRHGEAVAIGMVVEARLAEEMGLAQPGLADSISECLRGLGLPTTIPPGLDAELFLKALKLDKKNSAGQVRFAMPLRMGAYKTGVSIAMDFKSLLPAQENA